MVADFLDVNTLLINKVQGVLATLFVPSCDSCLIVFYPLLLLGTDAYLESQGSKCFPRAFVWLRGCYDVGYELHILGLDQDPEHFVNWLVVRHRWSSRPVLGV